MKDSTKDVLGVLIFCILFFVIVIVIGLLTKEL